MRKIIQLCGYAAENGQSLFALCDDGTVWEYAYGEWHQNGIAPGAWKPLSLLGLNPDFDDDMSSDTTEKKE